MDETNANSSNNTLGLKSNSYYPPYQLWNQYPSSYNYYYNLNRFIVTPVEGRVYRTDAVTGETFVCKGERWVKVKEERDE